MSGLFEGPSRPGGMRSCHICDEPNTVRIQVLIDSTKIGVKEGRRRRSVSRGRSYCQEHGEQVFRDLLEMPGFDQSI